MTAYRRNFIAGGSFFFAVNLADRRLRLLTERIDELPTAFRETRRRHPFTIDAIVVLPDHLHTVWTLPEGNADFVTRWRLITAVPPKPSAVSGSGVIGNIPFETRTISRVTSITFTSIRSSMAL